MNFLTLFNSFRILQILPFKIADKCLSAVANRSSLRKVASGQRRGTVMGRNPSPTNISGGEIQPELQGLIRLLQ